jgi:2'-5' RNA ligase
MGALLAHRYFFALLPDPVARARIHAWAERTLGPEGLQAADRLHVTLAITADFATPPPGLAETLLRAGERVRAAPFDLVLDRQSTGGRSVALRPAHSHASLRELQARIARAMANEGIATRPGWKFNPHVTLAYRESRPETRPVKNRGWRVNEFVLIHSLVGLTRHEVLGRWRLEHQPDAQLPLFLTDNPFA